jgi:hypothetical protein
MTKVEQARLPAWRWKVVQQAAAERNVARDLSARHRGVGAAGREASGAARRPFRPHARQPGDRPRPHHRHARPAGHAVSGPDDVVSATGRANLGSPAATERASRARAWGSTRWRRLRAAPVGNAQRFRPACFRAAGFRDAAPAGRFPRALACRLRVPPVFAREPDFFAPAFRPVLAEGLFTRDVFIRDVFAPDAPAFLTRAPDVFLACLARPRGDASARLSVTSPATASSGGGGSPAGIGTLETSDCLASKRSCARTCASFIRWRAWRMSSP